MLDSGGTTSNKSLHLGDWSCSGRPVGCPSHSSWRRAYCSSPSFLFSSTVNTVYNNDGSVTIDFRQAITDEVRNCIKADVVSTGRFENRWLEHVSMQDMAPGSSRYPVQASRIWVFSRLTHTRRCAVMVHITAWSDSLVSLYRYGNTVDSEAATRLVFLSRTRLQLSLNYVSSANARSPGRVLDEGAPASLMATKQHGCFPFTF